MTPEEVKTFDDGHSRIESDLGVTTRGPSRHARSRAAAAVDRKRQAIAHNRSAERLLKYPLERSSLWRHEQPVWPPLAVGWWSDRRPMDVLYSRSSAYAIGPNQSSYYIDFQSLEAQPNTEVLRMNKKRPPLATINSNKFPENNDAMHSIKDRHCESVSAPNELAILKMWTPLAEKFRTGSFLQQQNY